MDETLVVTTRFMTVGRLNYLKKLFQYLKQNQSEDCLYLNIYAPEKKPGHHSIRITHKRRLRSSLLVGGRT